MTAAVAIIAMAALCPSAQAGSWTLVSCTQPNGKPAPTDGWSTAIYSGQPASGDSNTCASSDGSLSAVSSAYLFSQANGSGPEWIFTAPPNSTIVGGTVHARLLAPDGISWIGTPGFTYDNADAIAGCVYSQPCGSTGEAGLYTITHLGGTKLYAPALCLNFSQTVCPGQGSASAVNAEIDLYAADIELSSDAVPSASHFSGPLLGRGAHGTSDLLFSAADANGPGLYRVSALIDHRRVYSASTGRNRGWCVPVGTDPNDGALMFDHIQPCRASQSVDVHLNTRALSDGGHDLQVVLQDAAGNASTVLDRTISTSNPRTTPLPRRRDAVHARLVVSWHWNLGATRARSIHALKLPSDAFITASCKGHGCPRLAQTSAVAAGASGLWRELSRRRFRAGDRLVITISAPHKHPERIEVSIRYGVIPSWRVL